MCLDQLARTKSKGTTIQAWDAGSTTHAAEDLYAWGADQVFSSKGRVNDGQNRSLQLNHFAQNESDELIYCIDNDAFHDPTWNDRLVELWNTHKSIVCLFNSRDHATCTKSPYYKLPHGSTIAETDDVVFRRTCGGISLLLERSLILRHHTSRMSTGYDWHVPRWDRHVTVSKRSYVAHMDKGGIHTRLHGSGGIDLGLNPTKWLTDWLTEQDKQKDGNK